VKERSMHPQVPLVLHHQLRRFTRQANIRFRGQRCTDHRGGQPPVVSVPTNTCATGRVSRGLARENDPDSVRRRCIGPGAVASTAATDRPTGPARPRLGREAVPGTASYAPIVCVKVRCQRNALSSTTTIHFAPISSLVGPQVPNIRGCLDGRPNGNWQGAPAGKGPRPGP